MTTISLTTDRQRGIQRDRQTRVTSGHRPWVCAVVIIMFVVTKNASFSCKKKTKKQIFQILFQSHHEMCNSIASISYLKSSLCNIKTTKKSELTFGTEQNWSHDLRRNDIVCDVPNANAVETSCNGTVECRVICDSNSFHFCRRSTHHVIKLLVTLLIPNDITTDTHTHTHTSTPIDECMKLECITYAKKRVHVTNNKNQKEIKLKHENWWAKNSQNRFRTVRSVR